MAPGSIPSCCLTSEQKDALIDAVRQRPVIWDCSLDAYQEVQNRRTAFVELAELLSDEKNKYTGPEMQVEWKKLRDIFNRTLKKVVASGGSDSEVTWRYWTKLQFITDHERSQINKAKKWCKKEEPSPPPASSSSTSSTTTCSSMTRQRKRMSCASSTQKASALSGISMAPPPNHKHHHHINHHNNNNQSTTAAADASSPLSLVQQLTEVAQNARELLKAEDDAASGGETPFSRIGGPSGADGVKMEVNSRGGDQNSGDEDSGGDAGGDGEESIGEALGQIFMLSKQIAENGICGGGGVPSAKGTICNSFKNQQQNAFVGNAEQQQMTENDLPIRLLLNEWMLKGAAPTNSTNNAEEAVTAAMMPSAAAAVITNNNGIDGKNAFRRHPSPPAPKRRMLWAEENGTSSSNSSNNSHEAAKSQQQQPNGGGRDQFDIFGMFIASQVRTLSMHSAQSALRLKRALTELCFQFEAQENNARRRTTTTAQSVRSPSNNNF